MKALSRTAKSIAPSATLAISALSKQMRADGIDVIGFGAGEPDFDTPEFIKQAGVRAIQENQTRYTPAAGIVPLREAICQSIRKDIGVEYRPFQICVSNGAKTVLYIVLAALLNPGDEVILPAPYWVTYAEAIRLCGGVPVIIDTDESTDFKISAEMLENAVTEKTKCIMFNNPSNPTGMVYTEKEMLPLIEVIQKHDLYVISDEIYSNLVYEDGFRSAVSFGEDMRRRTVLVNGVSKTYAMTGWRIGYAAAEEGLAKVITNIASHLTGSACTISQYAALSAYQGDDAEAMQMKAAFDQRRKYFMERVAAIDGVSALNPQGAFYVFMNIKKQLGRTLYGKKIESSADFAESLLKNGLVAVVPGDAFGADGYLRWSYATSMQNIEKGLDRLEKFLQEK